MQFSTKNTKTKEGNNRVGWLEKILLRKNSILIDSALYICVKFSCDIIEAT